MSYLEIIKIGFYTFDMIVLIFLILYLLGGFLKGWKKTLFNLIAFLVPFVIFMLMSDSLAKLLLQVEWPVIGNIYEYVSKQYGFEFGESSQELIIASTAAFVKIALYEVGITLCFIIASINRLIFKLTLKNFFYPGGDTKIKPKMSARLIGLGAGFGRFILAVVVLFFPLFGMLNMSQNVLSDYMLIEDFVEKVETNIDNSEVKVSSDELNIDEMYDLLGTSISYKVFNSMKSNKTGVSLPALYFGNIMKVKTKNGSINLVSVYGNLHSVIKVLSKVEITDEYISFEQLSSSDIKTLQQAVKKLDFIKVLAPVCKELALEELKTSDLENKDELINVLESMNENEEIDIILNSISELLDILKDTKIYFVNPEDILLEENLSEVTKKVLTTLVSSKTIQEFLLPYVCDAIIDAIDDETNQMEKVITKDNLKTCIETDISELITIYQNLSKYNNLHNYIFNDEELIIESESSALNLEDSIDKIFNLSIVKGNEKEIITFALSKVDEESLTYDKLFNDLVVNWQEEGKLVGAIVKELILLPDEAKDFENFNLDILVKKDENNEYIFNKILLEISKSQIFRTVGFNLLQSFKDNEDFGEINEVLTLLNIESIKSLDETSFYNELISLLEIVDIVNQMNLLSENNEYNITDENITELIHKVFNSNFIKNNESEIINFILEKTDLKTSLEEMNIELNFDDVNWETEPDKLINIFKAILKFGDFNDFDFENLLEERNEETNKLIVALLKALKDSDIFEPVLIDVIDQAVESLEYEEITNLFNIDALYELDVDDFEKEINNLLDIIDIVQSTNITENNFNFNNEMIEDVQTLLSKVFDSVMIKGKEKDLVDYILDQTGIKQSLLDIDITINYDEVNWETEPDKLIVILGVLGEYEDFNKLDIEKVFNERTSETDKFVSKLFNVLNDSDIFEPILFNIIDKQCEELNSEDIFEFVNFKNLKDLDDEKQEEEIIKALDILDIINNCDFNNGGKFNEKNIDDLFTKVYSSVLIKDNKSKVTSYLFDQSGLSDILQNIGVNINVEDENINWDVEPEKLNTILKILLKFDSIDSIDLETLMNDRTKENETRIIELFNALDDSDIFKDHTFDIVETMVRNAKCEIEFTETEKEKVRENTWDNEIETLFDIIDEVNNLLDSSSYETISGSTVTEMMKKASTGIIASKVIGTSLNEMLGEDHLNINPVENGKYKYDFRDPNVLVEQAESIGNLLDLRRLVNDNETSQETVVSEVVEVVKSLDNSTFTTDILNTIFDDSTIDEEINFNEEAELINSSYQEYSEGSISQEKLDELENSKLASEVLKKLGIID